MSENANHPANAQPAVLLISTAPSFSPARLAMALANCGFVPAAVCPSRHTLHSTGAVNRIFSYNYLAPLQSVRSAILRGKPDLLIPCDDWSASLLHELYSREIRTSNTSAFVAQLIENSLGSPFSFQLAYQRARLLKLAQNEELRVPRIEALSSLIDLKKWARDVGFPAVLKADSTSGGEGVRIVHTLPEAEQAFRILERPPMLAKALKRTWFEQDMALLWPALRRTHRTVNIQAFIAGRDATSAIACWRGKVLGSLQFEVLNKQDASGPSTALRRINNEDMTAAAEKLAERLNLSGFHGFDFILESETGHAHLIEMNPRATQVAHLALGPGRDLPAALFAAVTGRQIQPAPPVTDKDTIALFPQEWLKNPGSKYLRDAYHDVPWEEPEFVFACLRRRRKQKAWRRIQKWAQFFSRSLQVK